jgi:glycerophosphoryl diester phosphodiesterase
LTAQVGPEERPLVVAHRGASGYCPEHTLAAYALAIEQGADYIEPDLVATRDGVLVAHHANEVGGTTDVADRPEFAGRRTTKTVDGVEMFGWFSEDFTLAELKTLRTRERLRNVRPRNSESDGRYPIATLDEILELAGSTVTRSGGRVGVYVETKHPTYFRDLGLGLEEPLLRSLREHGYGEDTGSPVFLQSFETANLRQLCATSGYRLIQLIHAIGAPYDLVKAGDPRTYDDMVTPVGLREISTYAFGIGLPKVRIIPRDPAGNLLEPTAVVSDAHRAGLRVHAYTFRRENFFLPQQYRRGSDPTEAGDLAGEMSAYLATGLDGLFVDNPDLMAHVRARLAPGS